MSQRWGFQWQKFPEFCHCRGAEGLFHQAVRFAHSKHPGQKAAFDCDKNALQESKVRVTESGKYVPLASKLIDLVSFP